MSWRCGKCGALEIVSDLLHCPHCHKPRDDEPETMPVQDVDVASAAVVPASVVEEQEQQRGLETARAAQNDINEDVPVTPEEPAEPDASDGATVPTGPQAKASQAPTDNKPGKAGGDNAKG